MAWLEKRCRRIASRNPSAAGEGRRAVGVRASMAVLGQANISPSCCSLGFLAALSTTRPSPGHHQATTGPADLKVAWLLGLFEKSLPGSGKIFLGLIFIRLLSALGQPGGRSRALGPSIGLLTMGQFFAQVAQQPQGMINFIEPVFHLPNETSSFRCGSRPCRLRACTSTSPRSCCNNSIRTFQNFPKFCK